MIVRISKNGRSFKGAAAYYLHDKAADPETPKHLKPTSDDRVAFISTRNLVFDDPRQATAEMIRTANAQNELKRANGISLAGRKCAEPVKTLSLSWHPDEKPTPVQMIETADRYLRHMGWHEHQALIIGHDDTAHPHVHISVNRVHPETGRVLDDRLEYKRSQSWALEYEKEMGRIWCEARIENHKARGENDYARTANDNIPVHVLDTLRPVEHEFKSHADFDAQVFLRDKDLLKKEQREEREAWFAEGKQLFKETRHTIYNEVKEQYSDRWKEHFTERDARIAAADGEHARIVGTALELAGDGQWPEARAAFASRDQMRAAVTDEFAERAADIRAQQLADTRAMQAIVLDAFRRQREEGYKELLVRQQEARQEQREAHASGERATHLLGQTHAARNANENFNPRPEAAPHHANTNVPLLAENIAALGGPSLAEPGTQANVQPQPRQTDAVPEIALELPRSPEEHPDGILAGKALTGLADQSASAIGSAANYLADQLGELFAPTPPEVREAQAKAAEKTAREDAEARKPVNPFLKHAGMAENLASQQREEKERDDYWDDRERRRER